MTTKNLQDQLNEIAVERDALKKQLADEHINARLEMNTAQAAIDTARAELKEVRSGWEAQAQMIADLKRACPPAEAPVSVNWNMFGKHGEQFQITVRTGVTGEMLVEVMRARSEFIEIALKGGYKFPERPAPPPERKSVENTNGGNAAMPPIKESVPTAIKTETFAAATLAATITDGKTYWKVKGGRFGKWGVTVWPEVLDAAGFGSLNPSQNYDLTGWTAEYSEKDGKPEKVVRLYK